MCGSEHTLQLSLVKNSGAAGNQLFDVAYGLPRIQDFYFDVRISGSSL